MPAAASLKKELEKTENLRRRKKDKNKNGATGSVQRDPQTARGREKAAQERQQTVSPGLHSGSVSNESAGEIMKTGIIPSASNEHLRGLHGDNNGMLGIYTSDGRQDNTSDSAREELDKASYTVMAGGDRAVFTPSHYAAYLQIWGSPRKAVEYYTRYLELKDKKNTEGLDRSEEGELDQLERLERMALEFGDARHYMQDKKAYGQQDIDYAFAQNRYRKDGSLSSMFGTAHSPAAVYQSFFLDGVFGGMKDRYLSPEAEGGISEDAVRALRDGRTPETLEGMKQWLDKYLSDCVRKQNRGMTMILRSIFRSDPKHTRNTVMRYLENVLSGVYFKRVFVVTNTDARMLAADNHMSYALKAVMKDPGARFTRLVRIIIERIMAEKV